MHSQSQTSRFSHSRRIILVIMTILACSLVAGCSKVTEFLAGEVIQYKIEGIEDFEGIIAQRTLITPKNVQIVSRIRYRKPHFFSSEVLSPAEFAGYRVVFNGQTFCMYWPWEQRALLAVGLPPESPEVRDARIVQATEEITRRFAFTAEGTSTIADRPTYRYSFLPTKDNPRQDRGFVQLDHDRFLPLEIAVRDQDGYLMYHLVYNEIRFNAGLDEKLFSADLPEGTSVQTWDFSKELLAKNVAEDLVKHPILLPESTPEDMRFAGIRLTDSPSPMVLAEYSAGLMRLHLVQQRIESSPEPRKLMPLYLPVITKQGYARYYPMAGLNVLSWETGTISFSMMGPLGVSKLVELIDAMPTAPR